MSWIKKVQYVVPHQCGWPNLEVDREVGAGSVWECEDCEQRFIVVNYEGTLLWAPATGGATQLKRLLEDGVA